MRVDEQRNIIVLASDIESIAGFINNGNDFALVSGRNLLACKLLQMNIISIILISFQTAEPVSAIKTINICIGKTSEKKMSIL